MQSAIEDIFEHFCFIPRLLQHHAQGMIYCRICLFILNVNSNFHILILTCHDDFSFVITSLLTQIIWRCPQLYLPQYFHGFFAIDMYICVKLYKVKQVRYSLFKGFVFDEYLLINLPSATKSCRGLHDRFPGNCRIYKTVLAISNIPRLIGDPYSSGSTMSITRDA